MPSKTVIETALDEEMTEHLGYEKHETGAKGTAKSRNGTRTKTVLTETTGPVEIEVPRDREGTFDPVIVAKRQRRLTGVNEMVLSLSVMVSQANRPIYAAVGVTLDGEKDILGLWAGKDWDLLKRARGADLDGSEPVGGPGSV